MLSTQRDMDHCVTQIQYNYLDTEYQAGTRGLQYAASKGLAVVIMEGLRGGALAHNIPPAVQALWNAATRGQGDAETRGHGNLRVSPSPPLRVVPRTPADWALQWLWNQPKVSLVLSGMSTLEQVEQNLASADRSGVGTMSDEELELMAKAREDACTECGECLEKCPQGIDIPDWMKVVHEALGAKACYGLRALRGPTRMTARTY